MARSDDGGVTWRVTIVAPVLATTAHGAPLGAGLYDDFGTAVTRTGDDVAVYTQSCQGHPANDPSCPRPPGATGTYDVTRFAWLAAAAAPASPPTGGLPAPTAAPAPPLLPATGAPAPLLLAGSILLTVGFAAAGARKRLRRS
jgi:hypothetical protein